MAEIFPAGFEGLRKWIGRETDLRFGAGSAEDPEKRQSIFDEMCLRLYAEWVQHRWAKAFMPSGKRVDIPAEVWMRPEAERLKIAATGEIAEFWNAADYTRYYAGRVALLTGFTLVSVPVKQETEAEKIARIAAAQRAGKSLGSVPGWAPLAIPVPKLRGSRSMPIRPRRIEQAAKADGRLPVIDVSPDKPTKRPASHIQKKEAANFLAEYAATFNGGPKPTADELIAAAELKLGYKLARRWIEEGLNGHPGLKREPGEKRLKPKPIAH